ncbi:hypothetical protein D1B31_07975 [Neobacillus notoginsengisoli]|uniref:Uncharacterized protein n=1 Tax=Neobacillus notoginsengisoli TaxID=1578198 RepID=A0A417YWC9_9BACI|nr:hypothetical protein [Neobacillus notoginsengisoli]RHW41646.1 hypothetical protein D1B31_07975 [Neobacillus notoginsengisoli]
MGPIGIYWRYAKVLLGFILLDVYLNMGIAKSASIVVQLLLVVGFFPLLFFLLKWTERKEFSDAGLKFPLKWRRNLFIGFSIGFSF